MEHRLTERLATYWNRLRKDKPIPDYVQLNPSAISDIWQNCVLFTVQPPSKSAPPVISFHTIGDNIVSIYDRGMLGTSVSASHGHFQGAKIVRRMAEVINTPTIIMDEGQFVSHSSKVVKYRSCLLPFAGKNGRVTHIVVGLSWREY